MASDSWVPRHFRDLSTRLVRQNGIVVMGVASLAILLWTQTLLGTRVRDPEQLRDGLTAIVSDFRPGSEVEITWVSPAGATRASRVRLDSAPAV